MASEDKIAVLREWLADRPAVHDLVVEWPPLARVRAREGRSLMIPAPGVIGQVNSYFEDGNLGVIAPMAATLTSPVTGVTVSAGELISGECEPAWLELVEYGDFTPDDVRAALA